MLEAVQYSMSRTATRCALLAVCQLKQAVLCCEIAAGHPWRAFFPGADSLCVCLTLQEYYANTGALVAAAKNARKGKAVGCRCAAQAPPVLCCCMKGRQCTCSLHVSGGCKYHTARWVLHCSSTATCVLWTMVALH